MTPSRSARILDALRGASPQDSAPVLHGARLYVAILDQDPARITAAERDVAPGLVAHVHMAGAASLALISCEERAAARIFFAFLVAVLEGDAAQVETLTPDVDALAVVDAAGFVDAFVEGQQQRDAIDRQMGQA